MSTSALSSIALAQIIFKLRYANARYLQIAQQLRCRLHLTHHAKRRAYWVGLRVDITKAQNCPGTAISVKPLPIVDTTRSPATAEWPTLISLRSSAKGRHLSQASQLVHNQLGLQVPAAPRIVISSPGSCLNEIQSRPSAFVPSTITPNGHPRLIIRIPPLPRMAPLCDTDLPTAPIPGAPLLRSKELPVDSDFEMVDVPLKSAGSSSWSSPDLLTPMDELPTALRIRVPPKRKLQDLEDEDTSAESDAQMPKYTLKKRWAKSQNSSDFIRVRHCRRRT